VRNIEGPDAELAKLPANPPHNANGVGGCRRGGGANEAGLLKASDHRFMIL
jgi:hypothetical protein